MIEQVARGARVEEVVEGRNPVAADIHRFAQHLGTRTIGKQEDSARVQLVREFIHRAIESLNRGDEHSVRTNLTKALAALD